VSRKRTTVGKTIGGHKVIPSISRTNAHLISTAKMNPTLTIEPLHSTYASTDTERLSSSTNSTFESQAERAVSAIPFWCSRSKFEEHLETLIAMLSLVYLIGAVGFGGLLLFYTLSR
jgi:hypothetical protein